MRWVPQNSETRRADHCSTTNSSGFSFTVLNILYHAIFSVLLLVWIFRIYTIVPLFFIQKLIIWNLNWPFKFASKDMVWNSVAYQDYIRHSYYNSIQLIHIGQSTNWFYSNVSNSSFSWWRVGAKSGNNLLIDNEPWKQPCTTTYNKLLWSSPSLHLRIAETYYIRLRFKWFFNINTRF